MCSTLLVWVAVLSLQGNVLSEDYLPLATGNQWIYAGAEGARETLHVTGRVVLWGAEVWATRYENSTYNEGLVDFWTVDSDGDVNLWGFALQDGSGILYKPSVKVLDAPLYAGKEWSQIVMWYQLPDTTFGGWFNFTSRVDEEVDLVVPAGTFDSFGISHTIGSGLSGSFPEGLKLTGRICGTSGRESMDWWADEVGEVQYQSDELYQLYSYSQPTWTRSSTWGGIKALYR
jgi:hypothetical protein